jgi:16S rRNA (cytidine1402-2'-O)-methyltransferase
MPAAGTLYLVATPIGNPDDITRRALRILREADMVVCEERREGERLLARHAIRDKSLDLLNEHTEAEASERIVGRLREGRNVAVISDAGTPVFSDPGRLLVAQAIDAGITIVPVPGPSSLLPALTLSGFDTASFVFCGFLSPKSQRRRAEIHQLRQERRTMILMDTPYRLGALLEDVSALLGSDRRVCVAFNLTMPDEALFRGTASDVSAMITGKKLKGEFVLVVEGLRRRPPP